mmetsp:Transcript_63427/g.163210  ORF Transcript_63427/g.163210 Transcript_63427/m.163210 type:complete len:202 (+) Transcript_63427:325-930(+)
MDQVSYVRARYQRCRVRCRWEHLDHRPFGQGGAAGELFRGSGERGAQRGDSGHGRLPAPDAPERRRAPEVLGRHLDTVLRAVSDLGGAIAWMDPILHIRQLDQRSLGAALRVLLRQVGPADQEVERRLRDEVRQDCGPDLPSAHGPSHGLGRCDGGHNVAQLCRAPLRSRKQVPGSADALHGLSACVAGRQQRGAVHPDTC